MILRKWEDLPDEIRNGSVRKYYEVLKKKKASLFVKRMFDIIIALLAIIVLSPVFIIISIAIKTDSKGPIIFHQVRVTQYGKEFRIYKFRTMVINAEKIGAQITTKNDSRVTKVGRVLRNYRLDEIPQLFNIVAGNMSFVGTRPEVVKYVEQYTDEMMATLLLPAGVTSEASIQYKDEEKMLSSVVNADETYVKVVLPNKMKYNLISIEEYSFVSEIKTMLRTVIAVIKRDKDNANTVEFVTAAKNEVSM